MATFNMTRKVNFDTTNTGIQDVTVTFAQIKGMSISSAYISMINFHAEYPSQNWWIGKQGPAVIMTALISMGIKFLLKFFCSSMMIPPTTVGVRLPS